MKFSTCFNRQVCLMLMGLMLSGISFGAAFTATTSGNFSSTATWAGGIVPPTTISLDAITIMAGVTVNLDEDITMDGALAQLSVLGTLTTSNSSSLTMNSGILSGTGVISLNTIDLKAGTSLLFGGSLTANSLDVSASFSTTADIMIGQTLRLIDGVLSFGSGGSLNLNEDATIVISGGLLSVGMGGSVGLSGHYNVSYINDSSVAGVELTGSGLENVSISVNPGSSVSLTSDLTVEGMLSLISGKLILASHDLMINGDVTSTAGFVYSTEGSDITINAAGGTSGRLDFGDNISTVHNLTVNVGSDNDASISGDVDVKGTLLLTAGALNFDDADLTISGDISGIGALSSNSSSNLSIETTSGLSHDLNFTSDGQVLNNLTVSVGAGHTVSLGSDLTIEGTLALEGGSSLMLKDNMLVFDAASSLEGTGNLITNSSSDLMINSISGITSLKVSGEVGDVAVNTGVYGNVSLGSNLTVDGTLKMLSGELDLNGFNLTIKGDISSSASAFIASDASSDLVISTSTSPGGSLYFSSDANTVGDLTVNIGSNGVVRVGTDLNVDGTMAFTEGKLNIGANGLSIGANGSVEGADISSYVITETGGYVEMKVEAGNENSVSFPVGTITNFTPAVVSLNQGSASGNVQVNVVSNVLAEGTTGDDLSVFQPLVDATWHVSSDISSDLNMNLQVMWSTDMEVNGFDHTSAYVSHYFNGEWDASASAEARAESNGMFSLEKTGITSLSPFTVFDANAVTAVEDPDNPVFNVYPNPAMDQITIRKVSSVTEPLEMNVYNASGRLIDQFILNDESTVVSVNKWSVGQYFIQISNKENTLTTALTKM